MQTTGAKRIPRRLEQFTQPALNGRFLVNVQIVLLPESPRVNTLRLSLPISCQAIAHGRFKPLALLQGWFIPG
jgi:hypothetical protein